MAKNQAELGSLVGRVRSSNRNVHRISKALCDGEAQPAASEAIAASSLRKGFEHAPLCSELQSWPVWAGCFVRCAIAWRAPGAAPAGAGAAPHQSIAR